MATANKRPFRKAKNTAIYLAIRALMALVRILGRPLSLVMARALARAGLVLARGERAKMEVNLRLAYGEALSAAEREALGRKVFRNIAMNLVDAVLMNRMLGKDPEKAVVFENLEIAQQALARKKGIVFLTAHLGCFEMLPARFSMLGFPMIVIGAGLYDERLNRIIIRNRKSYDVKYVQRDNDIREILRGLREGGGFGVLCDLNTRGESASVPFFGRPARTLSGPFKLAIRTGAAMLPTFARRAPDGRQVVTVHPEIIPTGNTIEEKIIFSMETYNRLLEAFIRKDPAQWIWMHERWK